MSRLSSRGRPSAAQTSRANAAMTAASVTPPFALWSLVGSFFINDSRPMRCDISIFGKRGEERGEGHTAGVAGKDETDVGSGESNGILRCAIFQIMNKLRAKNEQIDV